MRTFNDMQDETLISLRGALRHKGNEPDGPSFSTATISSGN